MASEDQEIGVEAIGLKSLAINQIFETKNTSNLFAVTNADLDVGFCLYFCAGVKFTPFCKRGADG